MRGYKRIGTQRGSDQSQPPPPLLPRPRADSTTQQRSNCDTSPRQKTDWQYGAWFLHSPGELTQGHSQDERVTACSTSLMLQCLKSNRGRLCDYTTHVRHGVSNPEQNRPMKWHRAFNHCAMMRGYKRISPQNSGGFHCPASLSPSRLHHATTEQLWHITQAEDRLAIRGLISAFTGRADTGSLSGRESHSLQHKFNAAVFEIK